MLLLLFLLLLLLLLFKSSEGVSGVVVIVDGREGCGVAVENACLVVVSQSPLTLPSPVDGCLSGVRVLAVLHGRLSDVVGVAAVDEIKKECEEEEDDHSGQPHAGREGVCELDGEGLGRSVHAQGADLGRGEGNCE